MKKFIILFLVFYWVHGFSIAQTSQNGDIWKSYGFNGDSAKMDCEAWFEYEDLQNGILHFYAFTIPEEADYYFWDFGDGQTGTGEETEHFFDPALGDSFLVSLITITYDTLTQDSCVAFFEEEVYIYNGGDCINFFNYTTNDSITFTFFGEAIPEAFYYEWYFGDGEMGTGQTIEHTFDPYQSGVFLVTLSTLSWDTVFNDTCYAWSAQLIVLDTTPDCDAFFTWQQNPADPYTFSFYDLSTGDIDTWGWYFGDSTVSTEQNPVHTFSGPGEYIVCLTVSNSNTYCFSTYCDTILIEASPLEADFTFQLDSLSQTPNKYRFFDNSEGNPQTWYWDFDDGTTSGEMNPVHIYDESGSYLVCLEISKNTFNGIVTDTYCELITTPDYFDFGGVTYLGEFPMNNSGIISDTGIAYLYRKQGINIAPVDTSLFYQYGYYWFAQILQGGYIVKVKLTEGSEHYHDYLPSYYINSIFWKDADPIMLLDSNTYALDISLPEIQETESGIGSVDGYVSVEGDCMDGVDLSGITIILFDNNNSVVAFTETDSDGFWAFNNLPDGGYLLYAEASGLSTNDVAVSIEETNYIVSDIELIINCENTIGYSEYADNGSSVGDVYPNPVSDNFRIDIEAKNSSKLTLTVYSITGQKVIEKDFSLQPGTNTLLLNAGKLQHGSYLISVTSENNKHNIFRKFIK